MNLSKEPVLSLSKGYCLDRFSTRMAMSLTLQNPPSLACFRCYDSQHLFGADWFMRQHIYLRAIVNVVQVG